MAVPGRDRPQSPTLQPSESLFTQTGRPHARRPHLQLLLRVCHSLAALARRLSVFPSGPDSKSGHKLKKPTLEGKGPAMETAASPSCLTPSLPDNTNKILRADSLEFTRKIRIQPPN